MLEHMLVALMLYAQNEAAMLVAYACMLFFPKYAQACAPRAYAFSYDQKDRSCFVLIKTMRGHYGPDPNDGYKSSRGLRIFS